MLPAVLILIWFFLLLAFTFYNLHLLAQEEPMSWSSVRIIATFVMVFIFSVIVLLLGILVLLIRGILRKYY